MTADYRTADPVLFGTWPIATSGQQGASPASPSMVGSRLRSGQLEVDRGHKPSRSANKQRAASPHARGDRPAEQMSVAQHYELERSLKAGLDPDHVCLSWGCLAVPLDAVLIQAPNRHHIARQFEGPRRQSTFTPLTPAPRPRWREPFGARRP